MTAGDFVFGGITLPSYSRPSYDGGPTWIPAPVLAKVLRKKLAAAFPGTKFWIRSDSFAGGSSVDVFYDRDAAGAPKMVDVDALASAYGGADFDGSIDMQFSRYAYVDDDWNVTGRKTGGTADSRGYVPASDDKAAGLLISVGAWINVRGSKPYGVK